MREGLHLLQQPYPVDLADHVAIATGSAGTTKMQSWSLCCSNELRALRSTVSSCRPHCDSKWPGCPCRGVYCLFKTSAKSGKPLAAGSVLISKVDNSVELLRWTPGPPITVGLVINDIFLSALQPCIALGYELDDRGSRVRFPAGAGDFSLHHRIQNGSGAHPASCPMGTRGCFLGGKAAEAWSWSLTSS
jgi:hypothetical protein